MFATRAWGVVTVTAVAAIALTMPGPFPPDPGNLAWPGLARTAVGTPATSASLAIYYVGAERIPLEGGGLLERPKLYREFHRLPVGDGSVAARTRAAVEEMLDRRSAYDPDYRSYWPDTARVRDLRIAGDTVVVDVTGVSANGVGSDLAAKTLQQLVWTATANSGLPLVQVLLDGVRVPELWGVLAVYDPMRRDNALDTLALVWLISPQHGAKVGRTFDVQVAGMVHESTVNLRVRQGDRVVMERYVTLSGGSPSQGQAKVSLTLPLGRYTVEAFAVSMADGREMALDDHRVKVR